MRSLRRFSITLIVASLASHAASAGPINSGDINPASTLMGFDAFPGGTNLSNEFPGVTLSSGDDPTTGTVESSSFVRTTDEFPNATHSPPNKIVGTVDSGGGPVGCETCAIVI